MLARLEVLDPRWSEPVAGEEVAAAVEGRRVEALGRRGKYLVWELEDDVHLMLHLRMTGTLLLDPPEPPRYRRVRFVFDDGQQVYFDDPRRFGTGELALGGEARDAFFAARLGSSRSGPTSRARICTRSRASAARRSRRSCSTSARSRGSGTSTPTRRCSAPACTRCARRAG